MSRCDGGLKFYAVTSLSDLHDLSSMLNTIGLGTVALGLVVLLRN